MPTAVPVQPPPEKLLLTVPEAAALLTLSVWRVEEMVRENQIGHVALGKSDKKKTAVRIPRAAVDEFLSSHSKPQPSA